MSTQLATRNEKVTSIRALLEKSKNQIKLALPSHLSPDRMLRIAMTSIQKTPELLNCTPESLIGAVIQSAQLGLEPDGVLGHAYLVPYGKTCTFIPGYKGLLMLARRSGEISTVLAEVVHEKDRFEFELGLNPQLKHIPTDEEDEGPVIAAYAVAKLRDGGVQFTVMRRNAIEKIRAKSPAGKSGPWVTHYEEMAKKTVLRRLCKLLPCSVELERASALDERAEVGLPQDLEIPLDAGDGLKPVSRLDAVIPQGEHIEEASSVGEADPGPTTTESPFIELPQAEALANLFKDFLKPALRKNSDKLLTDWLKTQGITDGNGFGDLLKIRVDSYNDVKEAALVHAKNL